MLDLLKFSEGKATEDFRMPKTARRVIVWVAKGVGAVAVIVFIFAPFTNNGIALMIGSVLLGLACLFVISSLSDDADWPHKSGENTGYWPKKPEP
jgi:hypothetical protein